MHFEHHTLLALYHITKPTGIRLFRMFGGELAPVMRVLVPMEGEIVDNRVDIDEGNDTKWWESTNQTTTHHYD